MTRAEELAAIDTAIAEGKLIRITSEMTQAYFVLTVLERQRGRMFASHRDAIWRDQFRAILTGSN